MTFHELSEYFEEYASRHIDIKHTDERPGFVAVHADKSADALIKKCKQPMILVLVTPDKKLMPPQSENFNWEKFVCFFLLKQCTRKDERTIISAQNDCEIAGNDFFTVLYNDRHHRIRGFSPESFVMEPVGPMSEDYFGQVCMFTLTDAAEYEVNSARWL